MKTLLREDSRICAIRLEPSSLAHKYVKYKLDNKLQKYVLFFNKAYNLLRTSVLQDNF